MPNNTVIHLNDTSRQFCHHKAKIERKHLALLIKLTSKSQFLLGIFCLSVLFRAFTEGVSLGVDLWSSSKEKFSLPGGIKRKITLSNSQQNHCLRLLPLLLFCSYAWVRVDWWQPRLTGRYYEQTLLYLVIGFIIQKNPVKLLLTAKWFLYRQAIKHNKSKLIYPSFISCSWISDWTFVWQRKSIVAFLCLKWWILSRILSNLSVIYHVIFKDLLMTTFPCILPKMAWREVKGNLHCG